MRQTFVIRDGQLVPKHQAAPREAARDHRFIPDIRPFDLPDGTHIGSRSALRDYEQKHGVKQCGNDWTGSEKPVWWDSWRRGELING